MPIIKSAIKKLRKDRKRTIKNKAKKENLKKLIKTARAENSIENLATVFSALDKAAKTKLIHKNKASRLKSRLAKASVPQTATKTAKKSTPKKSKKTKK